MAHVHDDTPPVGGDTILAVVRAADVLTYLAHAPGRPVGVTELAGAVGLSKAVAFRILASLRERGYVTAEDSTRRYLLGPAASQLGRAWLDHSELRNLAHDRLASISAATDETATLSVRMGWQRVYIDQVNPQREIKMVVPIGRPFPLHAGSSSKALLAFLPPAEQDQFFRDGGDRARLTPATLVDEAALRAELARIRQDGYATSRGERQPDASSVAAPVVDASGRPVAVISVCGPITRFATERARDVLLATTRSLSGRLSQPG